MAVKASKTKAEAVSIPASGPTPAEKMKVADEYGALKERLAPHLIDISRLEDLRRQICSWYEDLSPQQSFVVQGEKYVVMISPRDEQRFIVDLQAVFGILGPKQFLSICKVPLDQLEKNATKQQLSQLVQRRRSGPRHLTAAALPAAA